MEELFQNFKKFFPILIIFTFMFTACGSGDDVAVEVSTEEMLEEVEYLVITSREHTDENLSLIHI